MIYYKDRNGIIYAYETEQDRSQYGASDLVRMTPQEVQEHLNPRPTPEQIASAERVWRNAELERVDIELNKVQDGMGIGTVTAWREYRCTLRNWPEHESFPDSSKRPEAPDVQ